jgi:MFS transporter, MHS family, proline/betaine transporter
VRPSGGVEPLPAAAPLIGARPHVAGARAIGAAAIGNALEWYDFSVYAQFAIFLAGSVLPRSDRALIDAFLFFGVGFVARPIGAIVLGAYADRSGRRAALTVSLLLMALGTLCIAIVPPYAVIGVGAPLLVVGGRLLQGLSAGGEIGGAVSFLVEHAPPQRRGLYASWLQASMAVSNILAALVATTLTLTLTPAQLGAWGWRIPFILGLSIAPLGLWLRARLEETPAFDAARREHAPRAGHPLAPVGALLREEPRALAAAIGLSVVWVIAVYTLVIYLPTYMQRTLGFAPSAAFAASMVGNVAMLLGCLGAGRLADRLGSVRMVGLSIGLILIATLPLCAWIVATRSLAALFVGQTLFCLIVAAFAGSAPAAVAAQFPARLRSTGVSLSYNLSATLFAGFTPALLTYLTGQRGLTLAPALYVTAAALVSLLALPALTARERP